MPFLACEKRGVTDSIDKSPVYEINKPFLGFVSSTTPRTIVDREIICANFL
jgi:hypothetical protein